MARTSPLVLTVGLLTWVTLALAQRWELEQVDMIGAMGAGLHIRRDVEGRTCLCYFHEGSGAIRFAWKDSLWHFEDPEIPPAERNDFYRTFSFDIGPHGEVGVAYEDSGGASRGIIYAYRQDSMWVHEYVTRTAHSPGLSFDASGIPNVLYGGGSLVHAERRDSTWLTTTVGPGGGTYIHEYTCWQMMTDRRNRLQAFCRDCYWLPSRGGMDITFIWIGILVRDVTSCSLKVWRSVGINGAVSNGGFIDLSMALTPHGDATACYNWTTLSPEGGLYWDRTLIDSEVVDDARIAADSLSRPHIAYVRGSLMYRYLDDRGWHYDTIIPGAVVQVGGIVFDSAGEPIVAFHVPGNGVWLAHGANIAGTEEPVSGTSPQVGIRPTIVRGVLRLPGLGNRAESPGSSVTSRAKLFDATGRMVLELQPGTNDVRHVSPGVYVVQLGDEGQHQRRKVVLTGD